MKSMQVLLDDWYRIQVSNGCPGGLNLLEAVTDLKSIPVPIPTDGLGVTVILCNFGLRQRRQIYEYRHSPNVPLDKEIMP